MTLRGFTLHCDEPGYFCGLAPSVIMITSCVQNNNIKDNIKRSTSRRIVFVYVLHSRRYTSKVQYMKPHGPILHRNEPGYFRGVVLFFIIIMSCVQDNNIKDNNKRPIRHKKLHFFTFYALLLTESAIYDALRSHIVSRSARIFSRISHLPIIIISCVVDKIIKKITTNTKRY